MPHNWIKKLNESNSRLHKEDVIKQALEAANLGSKDADTFLYMAWYAYNPYNTYNTTKVPVIPDLTDKDNPYEKFFDFLVRLVNREVTGNAAIAEIEQMAYNFDTDVWETLLRPVMLKDLRCGATIRTFNKICKGTKYEIPIFEAQLASDSAKHEKKLVGKKILESKLDGIRILAIVEHTNPMLDNKRKVTLYSRNGKEMKNFPHVVKQLENSSTLFASKKFEEERYKDYVLDGEIISKNFQALMKQAQRKTNVDTTDSVYTVFDIIPLKEFTRGIWNVPQKVRSDEYLKPIQVQVNLECPSIQILSGIEVDLDTAEGHDIMKRYGIDMVNMGYEGILIKDVDAPYKCKRGTAWMKYKPTITVDLEVIALEEGTGRNKGRLGALVCKGTDQGKEIEVNVGGGFSDTQRDEIWEVGDGNLGMIAEIKADVVTQNEKGTYSLRFPRFVTFRGFSPGEKI